MAPTMLDMAQIFGFRPYGRPVDAVGDYHRRKNQEKVAIPFTISLATINQNCSFSNYLKKFSAEKDKDQQHMLFLLYWLNMFVFPNSSSAVLLEYRHLAEALHNHTDVGLGPTILAHLFKNLHTATLENPLNLSAPGAFWMIQIWLQLLFEKEPEEEGARIDFRKKFLCVILPRDLPHGGGKPPNYHLGAEVYHPNFCTRQLGCPQLIPLKSYRSCNRATNWRDADDLEVHKDARMASLEDSVVLKLEGSSCTPTNTPVLNPVVIQNDASAVPNIVKLNGSNYPLWSKVLEMHIAGCGRKGFVTGSTKEPVENSDGYVTWETGNAIVKGWLINSMEPAIMGFFIHLRTAKEVWEEVAQTYYDGSDISQIYELKVKSFRLRQEGRPVGVYYTDLKSVWQELDQRRPIKMECAVDLKTLRDEIQIDRLYAFLASLDDIFDKRHATMMSGSNNQGGLPSMAMVSRPTLAFRPSNPSNQPLNSCPFTRENKDDLKCTFCGQTRHTKDTCFAKHGVPDWFPELKKKLCAKERGSGGNNGGRASLTRSTHGDSSFTAGTVGHVFLASDIEHHAGWILDSGATDHMTYDKNVFQYMTTSHREYIATANGTRAPIIGAGCYANLMAWCSGPRGCASTRDVLLLGAVRLCASVPARSTVCRDGDEWRVLGSAPACCSESDGRMIYGVNEMITEMVLRRLENQGSRSPGRTIEAEKTCVVEPDRGKWVVKSAFGIVKHGGVTPINPDKSRPSP
ncbi:unnamed protein product [Prunus armeniaca]